MSYNKPYFDLEWWTVQKRIVYTSAFLIIFVVVGGGIGYYLWHYGDKVFSRDSDAAAATVPTGARFISFDGDVRVVRAGTRETIPARSSLGLEPGDIVQTQADGRARIALIDGSSLIVRPNSVVQIRDNTQAANGQGKRVRVAVDRGQINVRTEDQAEGTTNVVETRLTENRLAGQTGATFGVREDNSEEVRVATGAVETKTRDGERLAVRGGQYVAVTQSGRIARVEHLMDAPVPIAPRDLQRIFVDRAGMAGVLLRWQKPASLAPAHYQVEVAASPFFVESGRITERDRLNSTEFGIRDLRPGSYFWRVRAVAASGQESEWSDGWKFVVAAGAGDEDEGIEVSELTAELVAGGVYVIRGRAAPGYTVRIADRETMVNANGRFQMQINVERNRSEINVEVENRQGKGRTYRVPLKRTAGA